MLENSISSSSNLHGMVELSTFSTSICWCLITCTSGCIHYWWPLGFWCRNKQNDSWYCVMCCRYDRTRSDLVGKNVNIIIPPPFSENHTTYVRAYITTGENKEYCRINACLLQKQEMTSWFASGISHKCEIMLSLNLGCRYGACMNWFRGLAMKSTAGGNKIQRGATL